MNEESQSKDTSTPSGNPADTEENIPHTTFGHQYDNSQGDNIHGDKVTGDKIQGDKIIGTKIEKIVAGRDVNIYLEGETVNERKGRCDFYQHIALPPNYVERPELLADVRTTLLSNDKENTIALTSAIKVNAFHGMGGIGKSSMARALCDDREVQLAFPDGILWATLGQTPDLVSILRDWAAVLGITFSETVLTVNLLQNRLAQIFAQQNCLLIVDDVWSVRDAMTFFFGGPKCRLLITTRDTAIAEELGATIQPIPVMTQEQALELLKEWRNPAVHNSTLDLLEQIVQRLGYLPLAIKLAGSQLRRQAPQSWLTSFDARKLKSRRIEDVHDSLEATFALSLDALSNKDRSLYTSLAIFREDEETPVVAIARLWLSLEDVDEEYTNELLYDLSARALLQLNSGAQKTVALHDLLRDFIKAELGDEKNVRAHRVLLDAYRATRTEKNWASVADDGYLYEHLVYHLQQIADTDQDAVDEMKMLFADQRWLHARVASDNYEYDGYITDLMSVWHRTHISVHQQIRHNQLSLAFADCVRYALIRTSINSLAANYAPQLIVHALEMELWAPSRALSTVSKILDAQKRSRFIAAILATKPFHAEGNQSIRLVAEREGITAILAIENEQLQVNALYELVPQLCEQQLVSAVNVALAIDNGATRGEALAIVLPLLNGNTKEYLLQEAFNTLSAIQNEQIKSHILCLLASHLQGHLLQKALTITLDFHNKIYRIKTLCALAPQLTRKAKEHLLKAGLTIACTIQNERERADVLCMLMKQLQNQQLRIWLSTVLALQNEQYRADVLAAFAPYLQTEPLIQEVLSATLDIQHEGFKAYVLGALAPQLNKAQLQEVFKTVLSFYDERYRVQAFSILAPLLDGKDTIELLQMGLAAALSIHDVATRARAISQLAVCLDEPEKVRALQKGMLAIHTIEDDGTRSYLLSLFAPHLEGPLLLKALNATLSIQREEFRTYALETLIPQMDQELLESRLRAALVIHDGHYQAFALSALASQLSGEVKESIVRVGLAIALAIQNDYWKACALDAITRQLGAQEKWRAVDAGTIAALTISEEWERVVLLSKFDLEMSRNLVNEGLSSALLLTDEQRRAKALGELAPLVPKHLHQEILTAAFAIKDLLSRISVLVAVIPHLNEAIRPNILQSAIKTTLSVEDDLSKVIALCALLPHLSGNAKERVLQNCVKVAFEVPEKVSQAKALVNLLPYLTGDVRERAIMTGISAVLSITDVSSHTDLISQFLAYSSKNKVLLQQIWFATIDNFFINLQGRQRENVLEFCANPTLFSLSIFPKEVLKSIAESVIEICEDWAWL